MSTALVDSLIIGTPTSTYPLRWQCQSKSRTYNPLTGNCPANRNPLRVGRPNNNRGLVDNWDPFCLLGSRRRYHQSYRMSRNMPLVSIRDIPYTR